MDAILTSPRRSRFSPIDAAVGMAAVSVGFYFFQNRGSHLGGPISPWKSLWLGYAITIFLIIPFFMGWRSEGSSALRRTWRVLFWVFAARSAVEMVLLYTSRLWACNFGIAHDLLCAALAIGLHLRLIGSGEKAADRWLLWFTPVYLATLAAETFNAYTFSRLADPARGIYFASSDAHFQRANLETGCFLLILLPAFASWLAATRRSFAP